MFIFPCHRLMTVALLFNAPVRKCSSMTVQYDFQFHEIYQTLTIVRGEFLISIILRFFVVHPFS